MGVGATGVGATLVNAKCSTLAIPQIQLLELRCDLARDVGYSLGRKLLPNSNHVRPIHVCLLS